MSDNNNNNNVFGTPNKKKRNELLDASFLSPHHVTSVMGSNVNLASPEMNNLMSVFMSPTLTTSQYNQNVPDSKDWTPSIQNKLPNDGFLTFPDTVTPGLFAQNNSSIHASRNSFSNLRPLNNNSSNNNSSSSNTNQNSNNLPSGGLSLSNLGAGNLNGGLLGVSGVGLSSLTQNQLHGVSGGQGLASPSLMSPLFPDLLDNNNNRAHPLSLVGNNDDLFFGVQSGSLLHHNHNSNSSSNNSNHFAQNAEALKNRLNKRKSSSSNSDAHSHMAGNTSLFSQATGHASSQPHSAHAIAHSNNSSMLPLSQSEHSQLSVSSDISGIAAITAAAAFMPPSAAQHQGLHPHSSTQKKKSGAKKSDSRMDEDTNKSNDHQHENEDEDEDEDEEDPQHATGQANRSFMSPEMRELSMRSITPKSAPHTGGNNTLIVCNCKKSKCLKMYCDCFRLSEYCKAGCNCVECCNIEKFDALRLSARKSIQDRNPEAFKPRVKEEQKEHLTGCHCRKSACLKKYCECYTGKVPCSNRCRCVDCQNVPSLYTNKQLANAGHVSGGSTAPSTTTGLSRSGISGSTALPSSNVKYTALNPAIPYINTTTTTNNNNATSSSSSQQNSAEKDLQSTSPSAAVAVLQTLSASKAFNQQSFLSNADKHQDHDGNAKPVKLFQDEDDDFQKNNTTTSNNTTTTTSSDALQIDTLTDKAHLQSLAQRTQSTSHLNNGNGNVYRDVCPSSGMDSTTSLVPPQSSNNNTNTNNNTLYGAFSPPQSPIRPTNRGTLSAVTSPKLMELADWCEERQPSREIEYPLPNQPASTDAK